MQTVGGYVDSVWKTGLETTKKSGDLIFFVFLCYVMFYVNFVMCALVIRTFFFVLIRLGTHSSVNVGGRNTFIP
jgi:hypothetical protein